MKRKTFLVMAGVGLLIGSLSLANCTSTPDNQADLVAKVKKQETRIEELQKERDALNSQMRMFDAGPGRLKSENEELTKQVQLLKDSDKSLQESLAALISGTDKTKNEQIEALKAENERLAKLVKTANVSPATSVIPESAQPGISAKDASIEKVKSTIADLEAQIGELQPKVLQARAKVTNLCRATIDRRVTGGGNLICGRGTGAYLYPHNRPYYYYGHTHDSSCYAPVWERIEQGNFRTQHDKDEAIRLANEEKLPLEQMLLKQRTDLEKAKQELGRLRRGE
jgi:outer membrane murein-binding lipoprotein Lpp